MSLIPIRSADGDVIGHVPNRASKNPVLGVIRCDCGEPATVHNPKGKRSGHYYTICEPCGTDQRSGKPRQAWLRANMYETVEALEQAERLALEAANDAAIAANEDNVQAATRVVLPSEAAEPESDMFTSGELAESDALETVPEAEKQTVSSASQATPAEMPEAANDAAYSVNETDPLPTKNIPLPTKDTPPKNKPIALYAVGGAVLGGLLALIA